VIGEVHGIVRGEVNAIMEMGNMEQVEETAQYLTALEMAELSEEKDKSGAGTTETRDGTDPTEENDEGQTVSEKKDETETAGEGDGSHE
jgi:hypothetical protein